MEQEILTAPPVEGSPEGTGSQAAPSVPQGNETPQETGQSQVETPAQAPSSPPAERPKVSDFYRERQRVQRLEAQVKQLADALQKREAQQQSSSVAPPPKPSFDLQAFYANPEEYLAKRDAMLAENLKKEILERELPTRLETIEKQTTKAKQDQEALNLIFPQNGSEESLEDRMEQDPERKQRILKILQETGADQWSITHPIQAAKFVLQEEKERLAKMQPKPNPAAPTKGRMVSTATGAPISSSNGGTRKMTLTEIKQERERLKEQADNDPSLRRDPKYQERWDFLKSELVKNLEGFKQ